MTTQDWLSGAGGVALAVAVLAGLADWRRAKRRDLDSTGWVPWRGLQVAAFFVLVIVVVLAVKE
jgi:hypothetical protein